ncbi:MAG: ATP-binding cassette domain-containing protein [Spirochaetaceae bacterium]|nr:ATP-binding cassette domain-containing protein [Spirochaetaceae bacterium]
MGITVRIRKNLSAAFSIELDFESSSGALGILGPSGSGKSMTLKCIAGIEKPDEGYIAVDGRTLFDSTKRINLRPQERRVGYLFQNYALFPNMTVLENILSPPPSPRPSPPRSTALRRAGAYRWVERFGLEGLENRYPRRLSGGQQQRAALARMLAAQPAAALFDEPFSALDSTLREYMQLQLQELLREDECGVFRNAILVTHNRDEAYRLCPELAVMKNGSVIVKGDTRCVFQNPRFVSAASLTGCKNISPVRRLSENEVFALDWGLRLRLNGSAGDLTHIGIRAHDLVSINDPAPTGGGFNEVRVSVSRLSSEPFEEVVLFTNADARDPSEKKEIWWKYSKYMGQAVPEKLFLPPEALLPLKDG